MTMFDAGELARGWLSVSLASSKDEDLPALHRTVLVESFSEGVRLVATDSWVLLSAWVPNVDHWGAPEPDFEEVPFSSTVAIDDHGRARGLMGHAMGLAAEAEKQEAEPVEVRLTVGLADQVEGEARPTLAEMPVGFVAFEVPAKERLQLRTYGGDFPNWRRVVDGFVPQTTERLAMLPDIAAQVAKLGKYHGGALGWLWGGMDEMARIEVIGSSPAVSGVVMPCRWDFEANAPRPDAAPPPEAEDLVDELLAPAAELVVAEQLGSITLLRQRLNIGSRRASDLLAELERRGLVGPALKGRPRPVLVEALDSADLLDLTLPKDPTA